MTTIGFAGLANTHPFADAQHLRELRPTVQFVAWDPSAQRRSLFAAEQPEAEVVDSLETLLARHPDAVVVSRPPVEVANLAKLALDGGAAVSITKPAATCATELQALESAIAGRERLVCTTSVLRFASDLEGLPTPIRRAHVVAQHHIDYWLDPAQRWQDEAGGLVPMMGVHALEMLERILGPTVRVTSCQAQRVHDTGLASPDLAFGTVTADGADATFEVDAQSEEQQYKVEVETLDGEVIRRVLGESGGDDPIGARAAARAVLTLADGGASPVAWEHSAAVLRGVVEARELAEGSVR